MGTCSPVSEQVDKPAIDGERHYLHFAHGETRFGNAFMPADDPGQLTQIPELPLLDQNPVPAYMRHPLPAPPKNKQRSTMTSSHTTKSLLSRLFNKRAPQATTTTTGSSSSSSDPTDVLNASTVTAPFPPGAYIDINNLTTQALVAQAAVARMQTWYEDGVYEWTAWWQVPVVGLAYVNFDMAFGNQANRLLIQDLLSYKNERNVSYMIDNYIDDQSWWSMFALRAYEMYGNQTWLNAVEKIAQNSSHYWSESCGGGVLWLTYRPQYQNTITNGLYFGTLARLFRYTGNQQWYQYALNTLNWWLSWGFEQSTGRVYDTIQAPDCNKTGLQSWSYNSGAFLFGLADLYYATGNTTLLDLGRTIAYAGMRDFVYTDTGIMHEGCEFDPQPAPDLPPGCQQDELFFKGIFMLGLAELYLARPDPNILNFINTNMLAVVFNNVDETFLFGEWWQGPWNQTTAGPKTQGNTMALLSAAALVNNAFLNGAGHSTQVQVRGMIGVPTNTTTSANAGTTAHSLGNGAGVVRPPSRGDLVVSLPVVGSLVMLVVTLAGWSIVGL